MNAPFNIADQHKQEIEGIVNRVASWDEKRICEVIEQLAAHLSAYASADSIFHGVEGVRDEIAKDRRELAVGDATDTLAHWRT